jgi:hypothetical protein
MGGDTVKTNFIQLTYVSPFEEEVVNSVSIEMMGKEVDNYVQGSVSSVLNFLQKSVVKSRNVGT